MNSSIIGGVVGIGKSLIDRLFPDPKEKAKAELRLLELQQNGDYQTQTINITNATSEKLI